MSIKSLLYKTLCRLCRSWHITFRNICLSLFSFKWMSIHCPKRKSSMKIRTRINPVTHGTYYIFSLPPLFSHSRQSAVWIFCNVRFSSGLSAAILPICPEKPVNGERRQEERARYRANRRRDGGLQKPNETLKNHSHISH